MMKLGKKNHVQIGAVPIVMMILRNGVGEEKMIMVVACHPFVNPW